LGYLLASRFEAFLTFRCLPKTCLFYSLPPHVCSRFTVAFAVPTPNWDSIRILPFAPNFVWDCPPHVQTPRTPFGSLYVFCGSGMALFCPVEVFRLPRPSCLKVHCPASVLSPLCFGSPKDSLPLTAVLPPLTLPLRPFRSTLAPAFVYLCGCVFSVVKGVSRFASLVETWLVF